MTEQAVKAIVIRKTKYKDNSAMITLFTESMGIISAAAYGIHSIKSGKAGALQLFMYGEFCLTNKNGSYTIKSAQGIENFESLSENYDALTYGSRLLTWAYKLFYGHQYNSDAFNLLYRSLCYTSYSNINKDDIYIWFLLNALNIIGICPCITKCSICGKNLLEQSSIYISAVDGGAVCSGCIKHAVSIRHISVLSLEAMRRILLLNDETIQKLKLPDDVRKQLLLFLEEYSKEHLG